MLFGENGLPEVLELGSIHGADYFGSWRAAGLPCRRKTKRRKKRQEREDQVTERRPGKKVVQSGRWRERCARVWVHLYGGATRRAAESVGAPIW